MSHSSVANEGITVDRERLFEILWEGSAGSERKVLNALCAFVRGASQQRTWTSGIYAFRMVVPVNKVKEAVDVINTAGGKTLAFRFNEVH